MADDDDVPRPGQNEFTAEQEKAMREQNRPNKAPQPSGGIGGFIGRKIIQQPLRDAFSRVFGGARKD